MSVPADVSERQRIAWRWSIAAWVALIVLSLAWELAIAPLAPGGSWLALKVVPLLLPLRSMLRGSPYGMQVAVLLVLLYMLEAGARILDPSPVRWLAALELALSLAFFAAAVVYLRPFKHAAVARRAAMTKTSTDLP